MRNRAPEFSLLFFAFALFLLPGCGQSSRKEKTPGESPASKKASESPAAAPSSQSAESAPASSSPEKPAASPKVLFSGFDSVAPIEAESAKITPPMRITSAGPQSWITVPEKAPTVAQYREKEGLAEIPFEVPAAGKYQIWFRRWWDSSCADWFYINIDNVKDDNGQRDWLKFVAAPANYRKWTWSHLKRPLQLSAGKHVLYVTNGNDGWRLDKILVTSDLDFIPGD